ncbi:NHL repeat-containing protein [Dactylosporangium sp. CA-092794]|uniref:NHL repeat-containing protein n=1 Tax=Dactylosporangium sp. CA-092794 TaxID=3239929 RepID=UPI003D8D4D98
MKTVRFRTAAQRVPLPAEAGTVAGAAGGWRPERWLGAPASGGLALPAARPTASWLYAPRGVHLGRIGGRDVLVVADTGNHRVLIWHALPDRDEQPCDVVLGQPDATSEGPAAGGTSTSRGMFLPTGVSVHDGRLIVADAWHHRVLVYDGLPESPFARPDLVLGQPAPDRVEPNAGGPCRATTMYWPFGVGVVAGRFYVADTGNRRVLGWSGGVPDSPGRAPDLVLGQPDESGREENRGGPPGPDSFRWPHDVCGDGDRLLVADAGNHRVLGWRPHPDRDTAAGLVIGQGDLTSTTEWPYGPQQADRLRSPYAADTDAGRLAVADTANNRVLIWTGGPPGGGADVVLGQPSFAANGENRWTGVTPDSMCWPYGISLAGDRLAVADSGNNRVVIWRHG